MAALDLLKIKQKKINLADQDTDGWYSDRARDTSSRVS